MNNDLISVIMCTYNEKPHFVRHSIESILEQTYQNFEFIIVIDNPLNIEIVRIVEKYALIDNRIIVVKNQRNLGLTKSLNNALKNTKGSFIARMDADDISIQDRLENQIAYIKQFNLDILGGGKVDIDNNGNIINEFNSVATGPEKIKQLLLITNVVNHPTWLVKREVYDSLEGYRDICTAEDHDFLLRASKAGFKIDNINKCLLKYRINSTGISQSNALKQLIVSEFLIKNFEQINNNLDVEKYVARFMTSKNIKKYNLGHHYMSKAFTEIKKKKYSSGTGSICLMILKGSKYNMINLLRVAKYKYLSNKKM